MSARAPRVLLCGTCLGMPMSGVVRHNQELLPRLDERLRAGGGRLAVLEGRVPIRFTLPGDVERIVTDVPWLPTYRRAAAESRALRAALRAARRGGEPFDLVHTAHQPTPRGLDVPFTLTIHDLRSLDLDRVTWLRRMIGGTVIARSVRAAARIGCVSEWMRGRIEEEFPAARGKLRLIGNGVDHLPQVPRRSPAEAAQDPFLLHVGHIEPRKNLDLVVRALGADPALPRLVLAGGIDGGTLDDLLALASSLGVRDRVESIQDADDACILELYASAACAVFPSRLEGFGIGPLEALRAGCPVAVSSIPAHEEHVADPGVQFPIDDPPACARAIRSAMAGAATAPARPPRTWDECADAWCDMLIEAHAQRA